VSTKDSPNIPVIQKADGRKSLLLIKVELEPVITERVALHLYTREFKNFLFVTQKFSDFVCNEF
jgi:hypothetical protein